MNDFQYYLPVNLIFGRGKTELLGKEAAKYGKRAMIVTGRSSTKESGLLDRALTLLKKEGIETVVFDKAVFRTLCCQGKCQSESNDHYP